MAGKTYFGLGGGGGGQAAIYGRGCCIFGMFSTDSYGDKFLMTLESGRWGPGLGGSGGAWLAIVSSVPNRYDLFNKSFSQWDFQVNLGGKWGDVLKGLGKSAKLKKLIELAAKIFGKAGKALDPGQWTDLGKGVKEALSSIGMDTDAKEPQFFVMSIPLAGGGLEVSVYKESFTVVGVDPW